MLTRPLSPLPQLLAGSDSPTSAPSIVPVSYRAGPAAPGHRVGRPARSALPGEEPKRIWTHGDLFVDVLPSRDLGNSSFVVGDRRRQVAVVIDPTRDVGRYLQHLSNTGLSLEWVLDTHLHADFVSGGAELAELSGAHFGIGAEAVTAVPHRPLRDREQIPVGSTRITVLHSPGHAPEHVSFLLGNGDGRPRVLFSGGSLMAGTAGRPDLLGPRQTYRSVRDEFDTLRSRYAALPAALAVLPTHAGGSFCALGAHSETMTTLGAERRNNPLYRARDRATFLAAYVSNHPFPSYYRTTRRINETGARPLGPEVPPLAGLAPEEVERLRQRPSTTVIDLREPLRFARGHVPGSLSIPISGPFSAWAGWLVSPEDDIVLVDDDPAERREAQLGLLRIGYDRLLGVLEGGVTNYERAGFSLRATQRLTMSSVRRAAESGAGFTLLDVRDGSEAALDGLPGSINLPLPELAAEARVRLDPTTPVYVHCQSGWRAGIAASLLERLGFPAVRHVVDGPEAWARSAAPRPRRRTPRAA